VTVIVPVLDAAHAVRGCIESLLAQSYPADRLEVIVVDNGSVDETRARVRSHPVTLLVERERQTPYAARNRGIASARGEILAFTDVDCRADKEWVARGVETLEREGADLAGGRVRFLTRGRPGAAEIFDTLHHLDHDRSIPRDGVAKTGNLFVRREVFDELGRFVARHRSGSDAEFTARAVGAGYALVYAPEAVVRKPARRAFALLRKLARTGGGQVELWRDRGETPREIWPRIRRCFLPMRPRALRALLRERGPEGAERRLLAVWLFAWLATALQGLARLRALGTHRHRPRRP
jgi:glycosyltransferase involved in cell wall biosynthesis